MSSSGFEPRRQRAATTPTGSKSLTPDAASLSSDLDFDSSGGVTISIGAIDSTVTKIQVKWDGTLVYESTTPNAPGQSAIAATFADGQNYTLQVLLWYPGWSRPSVYSASIVARNGLQSSLPLPRVVQGGA